MKPNAANTSTRAIALRPVFAKAAPNLSDDDLHRFCERLSLHLLVLRMAQLSAKRGTAPALKSLADLNRKIMALCRGLEEMGPDEKMALNSVGAPSQFEMMKAIADVNTHVVAAHKMLLNTTPIPTRGRGKPQDVTSALMAKYAAGIFEEITGNKPTFYAGAEPPTPFAAFLTDVFTALGISASAEHHARVVCEKNPKAQQLAHVTA